jgi:hypothetical protein
MEYLLLPLSRLKVMDPMEFADVTAMPVLTLPGYSGRVCSAPSASQSDSVGRFLLLSPLSPLGVSALIHSHLFPCDGLDDSFVVAPFHPHTY